MYSKVNKTTFVYESSEGNNQGEVSEEREKGRSETDKSNMETARSNRSIELERSGHRKKERRLAAVEEVVDGLEVSKVFRNLDSQAIPLSDSCCSLCCHCRSSVETRRIQN
jgi:hypothetical protein